MAERTLQVLADLPLPEYFVPWLNRFELVDWAEFTRSSPLQQTIGPSIEGVLTYGHPRVDSKLLELLPNLKMISNHGVGVDHIDLDAARARNIPVAHTPGLVDGATADLAITLMLVVARQIIGSAEFAHSETYRQPYFSDQQMLALQGCDVFGATLGIVGLGRIGKQIAQRASGFDMRVIYYQRNRNLKAEQDLGVQYAAFDALLEECDFVILSVPLDKTTHRLIGREQFRRMKPSAILVNVARGGVVDTEALVEALRENRIRGAGLDVTDPEPLPQEHPLFSMRNVTVLPHIGSFTEQTRRRMAEMTAVQLLAGLEGRPIVFDATRR